jgi:hypothetical protein
MLSWKAVFLEEFHTEASESVFVGNHNFRDAALVNAFQ